MKGKETLGLAIPPNERPPAVETNLLAGNNLDSILMESDLHFLHVNGLEGDSQQCQSHNEGVSSLPAHSNKSFQPGCEDELCGLEDNIEIITRENLEDDVLSNQFWGSARGNDMQPSLTQLSDASDTPSSIHQPLSDNSRQSGDGLDPDESPSDSEGMEKLVNQLSDRMGSLQIGSDGRVRYYGPTSHFNLLKMPAPDNLTIHRTVRKDGQDLLRRLGVGKEVPVEIEEHLINLYFTWHNPSFYVVDREMYDQAKQNWHTQMDDTPYYSEALTNAM